MRSRANASATSATAALRAVLARFIPRHATHPGKQGPPRRAASSLASTPVVPGGEAAAAAAERHTASQAAPSPRRTDCSTLRSFTWK